MAAAVFRKLFTAGRLFRQRGVAGIVEAACGRLESVHHQVRRWWHRDHASLGWFVQARGNRVRLNGCVFDVSHPLISNALRARLLRGRYERSERALLERWLDPAAPVVELGGGIGVIATLLNRRLHQPDRHVVVEAHPNLIPVIEGQKAANGAGYTVVNAAVSHSGEDTTTLVLDGDFMSGRIGAPGQSGVKVQTITLAKLFGRFPWTGATLVCDIEGLETDLVEHEGALLARMCDMLIVEIHPEFRSDTARACMLARLDALGFERVDRVRKVHVFKRRRSEPADHRTFESADPATCDAEKRGAFCTSLETPRISGPPEGDSPRPPGGQSPPRGDSPPPRGDSPPPRGESPPPRGRLFRLLWDAFYDAFRLLPGGRVCSTVVHPAW